MSNKDNKLIAAIKHNPGIFFYEKFTMEDLFTLSEVSTYFKDKLQELLKNEYFLATQITRRLHENLNIPLKFEISNLIIDSFKNLKENLIKESLKDSVHQIIFGSNKLWIKFITNEHNQYNSKYVILGTENKFLFLGPNIDETTNDLIELLVILYIKKNKKKINHPQ